MNRPNFDPANIKKIISDHGISDQIVIVGIRGYSATAGNKRGIYDDALFMVTPDGITAAPGNTDPSISRSGMAVLQPGVYSYKKGLHGLHHLDLNNSVDKAIYTQLINTGVDHAPIPGRLIPYWAFRQAGPVTVLRDGQTVPETKVNVPDWPWIDIHKGGYNTTSSEGCQTCFPDYWQEFRDAGFSAMAKYNQPIVKYILIAID